MYDLSKQAFEDKKASNLLFRKWIAMPCTVVSLSMLGYATFFENSLIPMWTGLSFLQLAILAVNHQLSNAYQRIIDSYVEVEQREKARALNPHKK